MPTEIQRLWLVLLDPKTKEEVVAQIEKEDVPDRARRIGARARQRYALEFKAFYKLRVMDRDFPRLVFLRLKAIGFEEQQINLSPEWFD
jgi:hypothetical protein